METDRNILIWLNMLNVSNKTIKLFMDKYDSLVDFWYLSNKEIRDIKGLRKTVSERICKNRTKEVLVKVKELSEKYDIITIFDDEYPEKLKNIPDRPKVLYVKGKPLDNIDGNINISIIGSRKSTKYGIWACKKFTKELVDLNVGIISGLALGIDSIAHKSALDFGGYTLGVLGNGIDIVYPNSNERLYSEMTYKGTILTEYPPGTRPLPYNFPQRNRIISGLSDAVIVIEAKEKSGSLITAHHALEQGKDIFALPGNINSIFSSGTNKLIKDGARPLLDIGDIIEEISSLKDKLEKNSLDKRVENLSEMELKIVSLLKSGPIHSDNIVYKTEIDISTVTTVLIGLELKGIVEEVGNNVFMLL